MNTIKFRGQILDGPRKGEWVYGYYYVNTLGMHCIVQANGQTSEVDPKTVGQYIGVKDKTDTEMYVGDKLQHEDGRVSVIECDLPHFILRHKDGSSDFIAKRNIFKILT